MPTLEQTIELLKTSISGTRKGSETPTYIHSVRVGALLKKYGFSDDVEYAGMLHDIIEDGDHSFEQLRELGYSERAIALVDLATFDMEIGENQTSRKKMMERLIIAADTDAWAVKLADMIDNLTECHLLPQLSLQGYLFIKAPLFIYYGNLYFGGSEFYNEFIKIYWEQVRRYHQYFLSSSL